jgi:hypothetical protein
MRIYKLISKAKKLKRSMMLRRKSIILDSPLSKEQKKTRQVLEKIQIIYWKHLMFLNLNLELDSSIKFAI